jgi:Fe-S-cluster containining protein
MSLISRLVSGRKGAIPDKQHVTPMSLMTDIHDYSKRNNSDSKPPAPRVPVSAQILEKRIISLLHRLIRNGHSSCLDKGFRSDYEKVLNLFSLYQNAVLSKYPLRVTCGPRCGVCCYHWPEDTYSFEVLYIASFLKKSGKTGLSPITDVLRNDIACFKRIRKEVRSRFSKPREKTLFGDIDPYDIVLSSFYQFRRPCPLLTKNGSCSIHSIRPFSCRVYISFSPKEYCRPSRIASDRALTYLLDLEQDASDLFDRLHFMYDIFDGDTSFRSMLYKALI